MPQAVQEAKASQITPYELPCRLANQQELAPIVAALNRGGRASLEGVWGSACALVAAAFADQLPGPLVLVAPGAQDIDPLCDELALFSSHSIERFPAWETAPSAQSLSEEIYGDRLRTLKLLATAGKAPKVVVTSVQSLLQPTPTPDSVVAGVRRIRAGQTLDVDELLRWLTEKGFHHSTAVELPGEFSLRGGILDIYPPDWMHPVRIELFDDLVESVRTFDVSNQRSLEAVAELELAVLEQSPEQRGSLFDFFGEDAAMAWIELSNIREQGRQFLQRQSHNDCLSFDEMMRQAARFASLTLAHVAEGQAEAHARLRVESVQRLGGGLDHIREGLDEAGKNDDVFLVCETEAEAERLSEVFAETEIAASGRLHYPLGAIRAGFRLPRQNALMIGAAELFERTQVRRPVRRRLGKAIDSFVDLRPGDLVVHLSHGIGRYRGMQTLTKGEQVEEHLEIEFHGGAKIYVPASKIGLVQKYIGGTKTRPRLAKIGGKSWERRKKAAEMAVTDLAVEMLDVQAARASRPGIALAPDTDWQREFEAAFPYHETPDQLDAIKQIREDQLTPRPMDRLLCGDVGFGKTEVAMRAAFKAIDNGYQVALLAPTTILVEQHYQTFRQRMAEFPCDIAKLSRFCTRQEEKETLAALAEGKIDAVVGTHRLASRDVHFHNLGLVIIDEEQRFGVNVKERLKSLRNSVDVLTLSATPIPRTLHMSLVGIRDISNLQTPPEDRIGVETHVERFDDDLVREAILRELNRGGQVYFVHNRVQDIEEVAMKLRSIVPEAEIRVGHAQMNDGELERVMIDFVSGKFDVLVATTIVESGLDIPNANTIFIHEPQRYGLADLHQLRGRVGRYKHRAFCYLLLEPHKSLTPNAARRLLAIEEFSELGAGFALAMRDLEIRGAGNLLGSQQSGHISAVGYELYCEMLERAVRKLKNLPAMQKVEVEVELPGEAYLPRDYVPDLRMKIDLYRRLARVTSDEELEEFASELVDRFGPLPESARRMIDLTALKIDAAVWQIASIFMERPYLVVEYEDRWRIDQLARHHGRRFRVVDDRRAYVDFPDEVVGPDAIYREVKSVLRPE